MDNNAIASASSKLELLTIALHECSLARDKDEDPFSYPRDLSQQSMLRVKLEKLNYESGDESIDILRCYVSLVVRAGKATPKVKKEAAKDKSPSVEVYYTVEATYRVDYQITGILTKEEAEEFSNFNSVHNVWPFWRFHVFETLRSAELPPLRIPLMRGLNVKNVKKELKRKIEGKRKISMG